MMKLVFSKNNLPLSKLIRWATNESVSHVALVFDNKYVFHSNLKGAHINSWAKFSRENIIMAEVVYDLGLVLEEDAFQAMIVIEGKWYDVGALLFWGLALIRKKITGQDLPKHNLWASDEFFTCVEVLRRLPAWVWPAGVSEEARAGELTPGEAAQLLGATWL